MAQYVSRIHIRVSDPAVWAKFEDEDDLGFHLAELANTESKSFVLDCEEGYQYNEEDLEEIIFRLAEILGEGGIIVADTTNINTDAYDYCILYLGDEIRNHTFSLFENPKKRNMFDDVSILNIAEWLDYGGFQVSDLEKTRLFSCGITCKDGRFFEFSHTIDIPSKIYLRETWKQNRPEIIEKLSLSESVHLVHAKDQYDPLRLEVKSQLGTIGSLPSDVSESLAPLLLEDHLKYDAKIIEVIPLSQRNKHAKSPIVAICIYADLMI